MTDLSSLSDDQLKSLYGAHAAEPDLSKMSDDDLKALHASTPEKESVTSDVLKSGGTGVAKGAIGLAGLPGDASDLLAKGSKVASDYIAGKLGFDNSPAVAAPLLPTSAGIQKGIEGVTGEFHRPQTTAGEYAQTVGEFAPALLGGGEGLMARMAKQVVAPAVTSETAGQLTKGTAAEPYARIAGAVGGGGLASVLGREAHMAAPTVEELKDAARAQYNHPDVTNVRFAAQPTEDLANRASIDLRGNGFRPNLDQNGKPVFQLVDELRGASNVADIDGVRKALGNIAKDKDATGNLTPNAVAANRAINHINDFLPNLRQSDVLAGDAGKASQILQEAGQNWGAAKRAEEVATRAENARIQAASTYGGGNINNALRQALRPLVKNDFQKARGFNPAEQDALERTVTGSYPGNLARQVGKLGPDTGLKGIEHIIAAVKTGGASIPFSVAALGAKLGGDASTRRAIGRLDTMLRERSPLHQENLANVNSPTIASRVTPGVTLPNPNYVPPVPRVGAVQNGLVAAVLASQPYRGPNLGSLQRP